MTHHSRLRWLTSIGIGAVLTLATTAPVRAQSYISPFIGFNFGGDASCPEITNCEDKRIGWGGALGKMGPIFGIEEELGYTNDFFGSTPSVESSVLTLMTHVLLVPKFGPIRPFGLAGLGAIRSHAEDTAGRLGAEDDWDFSWDVGGGLMVLFSPHVGIRGDIRYFHAFNDLSFLGVTLSDTKLDFGRASGSVVFTF